MIFTKYPNNFCIKNCNFDPYNILLAIATNISVLVMTGFMVQGHICVKSILVVISDSFQSVSGFVPYLCNQRYLNIVFMIPSIYRPTAGFNWTQLLGDCFSTNSVCQILSVSKSLEVF